MSEKKLIEIDELLFKDLEYAKGLMVDILYTRMTNVDRQVTLRNLRSFIQGAIEQLPEGD